MPKGYYERKKGIKRPAVTFSNNFWSKKRVEQNITMKEIAELLGIKVKTASSYFTGQALPPESLIMKLCDFFDVDTIEGEREFINAHKAYDAMHKRTLILSAKTQSKIKEATKISTDRTPTLEEEPTLAEQVAKEIYEKEEQRKDKLFEVVYGKLDCWKAFKEFAILINRNADVREWLYGKVDFDTYEKVKKILEE